MKDFIFRLNATQEFYIRIPNDIIDGICPGCSVSEEIQDDCLQYFSTTDNKITVPLNYTFSWNLYGTTLKFSNIKGNKDLLEELGFKIINTYPDSLTEYYNTELNNYYISKELPPKWHIEALNTHLYNKELIIYILNTAKIRNIDFNTRRIETITSVNAAGDTIVRDVRRDIVSTHSYYGSFETGTGSEAYRRVHTSTGFYDCYSKKPYYYLTNRQSSVMAVVDIAGNVVQRTGLYPSGTPYIIPSDLFKHPTPSLTEATDRLHIGNRWLGHSGLNRYDNTARLHDPILFRFDTPDPLASKYQSLSPWFHTAANPVNGADINGNEIFFDAASQEIARNMLSASEYDYLQFDEHGKLSINAPVDCLYSSLILSGLDFLVNENSKIYVTSSNSITFLNPQNNEITTELLNDITGGSSNIVTKIKNSLDLGTGEIGWYGSSIYPSESNIKRSLSGDFEIVINYELSHNGASQSLGHELLGHAYVYYLTGNYLMSTHNYGGGGNFVDERIIQVVNEIIRNQSH